MLELMVVMTLLLTAFNAWCGWLERRHAPRLRWLLHVRVLTWVMYMVSMGVGLGGLVGAFHAVQHAEPANKATTLTTLAQGIGWAMNGVLVGILVLVGLTVLLGVLTLRRPRASKPDLPRIP